MAVSGIGVQPVEGRWSAAQWSGDPLQPINAVTGAAGPGVWSGDLSAYLAVPKEGTLKRGASATVVRGDGAALKRAATPGLVRAD